MWISISNDLGFVYTEYKPFNMGFVGYKRVRRIKHSKKDGDRTLGN